MEIENALIEADIDYRTPPMAGYLQRDEILFLRGLLAIALRTSPPSSPSRCAPPSSTRWWRSAK
jgi:hypothetical protein